jgi:hypothetical protein
MPIEQIVATIIRGEQALKFPLKIHTGWISDANGNHILDVRGWGYLQYHKDGNEAAAVLQDAIGDWVVETLNAEAKRKGLITV